MKHLILFFALIFMANIQAKDCGSIEVEKEVKKVESLNVFSASELENYRKTKEKVKLAQVLSCVLELDSGFVIFLSEKEKKLAINHYQKQITSLGLSAYENAQFEELIELLERTD